MKFIFATDLHMHNFTDFSIPDEEYITSRFYEQIVALEKTYDIARKNDATLIIGGDVFHRRGSVKTEVFNKVFETISRNNDIETYILRGNHDSVTNSLYSQSSLEPLSKIGNVHVITKPCHMVGEEGEVNITFLPYGDEIIEMKEFLNTISKDYRGVKETQMLVAHIGLEGATQGKHSHRLSGAFGLGDLHPEFYDFILLGHYHKRQGINSKNPNHLYGGSFMQHNFGDEGQDTGVHLIDTEEMTTTFIPIDTPQFVTIDGKNIPDNLEDLIRNNYVRFVGNSEEVKAVDRLKDITDFDLSNIRVELQRDYNHEARMGLDATMSEEEIVRNFAKQKFPNSIEEALECLNEAQQYV